MTGWGQDGPLAAPGRPRPDVPRGGRCAAPHRPGRPAADTAAEPRRRLRRRGDDAGVRRARGAGAGRAIGSRSGRRRRHGRRCGAADVVVPRPAGAGAVARRGGHQPARRRVPRSTTCTRPRMAATSPSARWSRRSTPHCWRGLGLDAEDLPDQYDVSGWPRAAGAVRGGVRHPYAGRVGRAVRRHRRLRGAGAVHARGADASASRGAGHLHHDRRDRPAGAGSRFSGPPAAAAAHRTERRALLDWGFTAEELADLRATGALILG